jgi:hypothetical protein
VFIIIVLVKKKMQLAAGVRESQAFKTGITVTYSK